MLATDTTQLRVRRSRALGIVHDDPAHRVELLRVERFGEEVVERHVVASVRELLGESRGEGRVPPPSITSNPRGSMRRLRRRREARSLCAFFPTVCRCSQRTRPNSPTDTVRPTLDIARMRRSRVLTLRLLRQTETGRNTSLHLASSWGKSAGSPEGSFSSATVTHGHLSQKP